MIEFITTQLQNNELLQAAVVAAPMTALMFSAKNIPYKIYNVVKRYLTVELMLRSDMAEYEEVKVYITKNFIWPNLSRNFSYHAERQYDDNFEVSMTYGKGLSLGYGTHFGKYKHSFFIARRTLMTESLGEKYKESLDITFFTRSKTLLNDFINDIDRSFNNKKSDDLVPIYKTDDGGQWYMGSKLPKRSMSTVFLPDEQKEKIINYLENFTQSKERYRQRGLPWHTGILLTGQPGTGKTSFIHAIASETQKKIFYLNLGSIKMENQLNRLFSHRNWNDIILVIEDVDTAKAVANRTSDKDDNFSMINLSSILNIFDGMLTPDGLVVIATTNYPEKLDDAFKRPGRFDIIMNIGPLDWPEFEKMVNCFFPGADISDIKEIYVPTIGAKLRSLLLDNGVSGVKEYFKQK